MYASLTPCVVPGQENVTRDEGEAPKVLTPPHTWTFPNGQAFPSPPLLGTYRH